MNQRCFKMQLATDIERVDIDGAAATLQGVAVTTPLMTNINWSNRLNCKIYFKREDLQVVRSYKIRGAFNKISSLSSLQKEAGVVCASAGNHAQGVAYSCSLMNINGVIFMPTTTPNQKLEQVKMFGGKAIEILLQGDTFDDAADAALKYCRSRGRTFIHPFNDQKVIEGQGTVGKEIIAQAQEPLDYIFLPVGGGGLAAGVASYVKTYSPKTKIIGVEPEGASSLTEALKFGSPVKLNKVDKFIDGASVKKIGELNFNYCQELLDDVITVPEGAVCTSILELYNKDAIVVEPAGALALTGACYYSIPKNAEVAIVLSGSNNDITRMEEIKERSLLHEELKHYFLVSFPQRAGALKDFVNDVLGPDDDITLFEYQKRHSREKGPVKIGIQLAHKSKLHSLIQRMNELGFIHEYINNQPEHLSYFV